MPVCTRTLYEEQRRGDALAKRSDLAVVGCAKCSDISAAEHCLMHCACSSEGRGSEEPLPAVCAIKHNSHFLIFCPKKD